MPKKLGPFWSRIDKIGECWLWNGSITSDGYGSLKINQVFWRAHRYAYTLAKGQIPADMLVCHTCDVRHCVNPDHLWLGTHQENSDDMRAKGRNVHLLALSDIEAIDLRLRFASGKFTVHMLAKEYDVSKTTIGNYINRHTKRTDKHKSSAA